MGVPLHEAGGGQDGIHIESAGNQVNANSSTVINANQDGIDLAYDGAVGSPSVFASAATIFANNTANEIDDNILLSETHVPEAQVQAQELIELVAKWRGEEIEVGPLPGMYVDVCVYVWRGWRGWIDVD